MTMVSAARHLLLAAFALVGGCGGGSTTDPPPPPPPSPTATSIVVLAGDGAEAEIETATNSAPRVRILGRSGPLSGIPVRFVPLIHSVPSFVADSVVVTDASGEAATVWTLGRSAGEYTLIVRVAPLGDLQIVARARPGPPAIFRGDGSSPFGAVGEGSRSDAGVALYDRWFNPIADHLITFEVVRGGGQIERTLAGDGQSIKANGLVSIQPKVRALDALGQPFPGSALRVEFLGPAIEREHVTTGPDGVAALGVIRMGADAQGHIHADAMRRPVGSRDPRRLLPMHTHRSAGFGARCEESLIQPDERP